MRRLEPPTRISQANGDLGAAADDVAVADSDRRLGEGDDLVVDVGEELHASYLALLVELLLDVGTRREAHLVGGAEDEHPHRIVGAGDGEVLQHLDEHLGVDRVAGLRPLQTQHRHALLVDLVARHLRGFVHAVEPSSSTSFSVSSAARSISATTSSRGSRKRQST